VEDGATRPALVAFLAEKVRALIIDLREGIESRHRNQRDANIVRNSRYAIVTFVIRE